MKRSITILSSMILLVAICLSTLSGCVIKNSEENLYSWLLENGELVNGTELMYKDNSFALYTGHSQKMFVDYTISDYKGYEITVQLPLFSESKKVVAKITVQNKDSSSIFECYHYPDSFTMKTPLEYGVKNEYPDFDVINLDDYGTMVYEDGKYVFHFDESKREEYEKKTSYNAEITKQRELREEIAKDISHKSIAAILDWINEEVAKVDISDLGYKVYK